MNTQTKTIIITSLLCIGIFFVFFGCTWAVWPITQVERQTWEYKVTHFSREDYMDMDERLEKLGDEGWEYAGPLTNDGINAQFVVFKREKEKEE